MPVKSTVRRCVWIDTCSWGCQSRKDGASLPGRKTCLKMAYSFSWNGVIWSCRILYDSQRSLSMEWTTPQHEEIELNCEVSSYANAEL